LLITISQFFELKKISVDVEQRGYELSQRGSLMLNCKTPAFEETRHFQWPITGHTEDLALIKIRLLFRLRFLKLLL